MGQKLNNAGAKRVKILENWRRGVNAVWELSIDYTEVNKELSAQIAVNEKKLTQLVQSNNELKTQLEGAKQKLKEIYTKFS